MAATHPINARKRELHDLAERQHGFFTAQQAETFGYVAENFSYHAKQGNWLKIRRGLYRLPGFADSPEAEFTFWSLWSADRAGRPQGVISHDSALAIHGLADFDLTRVHLTVPWTFRKKIPTQCVIHKASLTLSAIEARESFMVTRLDQTLLDLQVDLQRCGRWAEILTRVAASNPPVAARLAPAMVGGLDPAGGGSAAVAACEGPGRAERAGQLDRREATDLRRETEFSPSGSVAGGSLAIGPIDELTQGVWRMMVQSSVSKRRAQAGFTLVELLVVMAIISVLAGMLLPVLGKVLASGRNTVCQNNLKNLGAAIQLYAGDFGDWLPPACDHPCDGFAQVTWAHLLVRQNYLPEGTAALTAANSFGVPDSFKNQVSNEIFRCPSRRELGLSSFWGYGATEVLGLTTPNNAGTSMTKVGSIQQPTRTCLLTEFYATGPYWWQYSWNPTADTTRPWWPVHLERTGAKSGKSANFLLADAHVNAAAYLGAPDYAHMQMSLWGSAADYRFNHTQAVK